MNDSNDSALLSTSANFTPAERLNGLGSFIMVGLTRQAAELRRAGVQVINLSAGVPDYPAPEFLLEAGREALKHYNTYGDPRGVPELRKAVAAQFKEASGLAVSPDDEVTITAGASAALQAVLLAYVNPGDEVTVFEPYYEAYLGLVALSGGKLNLARLPHADFAITRELLDKAITPATRVLILNTPHNPSGRVFSRNELQLIAEYCIRHNVLVLSDEAYAPFVFDGEHVCIASLPGMRERTVTINSIAKVFNVAGWRIGHAVAPADITANLRRVNDLPLGAAVPLQHACVNALAGYDKYVAEALAFHRGLRDRLYNALTSAGFRVFPAHGTLSLVADASHLDCPEGKTPADVMLERWKILTVPAAAFYRSDAPKLLRFSFARTAEVIEQAEKALANP